MRKLIFAAEEIQNAISLGGFAAQVEATQRYAQEAGLSKTDKHSLKNIVLELLVNIECYTPQELLQYASIEITKEKSLFIIRMQGVINKEQYDSLSAKVDHTDLLTTEELWEYRKSVLLDPSSIVGGRATSKGSSLGTITIAALAQGEIFLTKGKPVGDGKYFHFKEKIIFKSGHSQPGLA